MFAILPMLARAAADIPARSTLPPPSVTGAPILAALVVMLGTVVVMQIAANWVVSKMLVSENNDFANALKLWATTIAGVLGAAVLAGLVIAAGRAADARWVIVGAGIGFVLLALYVCFATPMKVYKINFVRAFVFVLLASLIETIGQFSAMKVLPMALQGTGMGAAFHLLTSRDTMMQNASASWLRKAVPSLGGTLDSIAVRTAADRSKPLDVRRAALQQVRDSLEARRVALNPKDPAAIAAYKHDAKEYGQWLHEVEAQAAKPVAKP